jgi:peptide/nickel transport system substrate-binding protein
VNQAIATDWARIGVRAVSEPISFTGLVSDFLVPRNYSAAVVNWELIGDPDPYPLWSSSQISPEGQNYGGWNNREADIAMEQARITADLEQRRQHYYDFQRIFAEDVPAIMLYHPLYTYAASTAVNNMEVGRLNEPSDRFRTFADWYTLTRKVTQTERRTLEFDNLDR